MKALMLLVVLSFVCACGFTDPPSRSLETVHDEFHSSHTKTGSHFPMGHRPRAMVYTVNIKNSFPHDTKAFTQGLAFDEGKLYEGTGLFKHSQVRVLDLSRNVVLESSSLKRSIFGEGLTVWGDTVIQLTWESGFGRVCNKRNLTECDEYNYPPDAFVQGWGITHDSESLIISDGSSWLYFLDGQFNLKHKIRVRDETGSPVNDLNELEYINGEIWANMLGSNCIVRILPETGGVVSWIYADSLVNRANQKSPLNVLNGIAYDALSDRLVMGGKRWPEFFEVSLVPKNIKQLPSHDQIREHCKAHQLSVDEMVAALDDEEAYSLI